MVKMNDYLSYKAAKEITILVIHDKDDLEVPVKAAQHYDHLKNGKPFLSEGLGHRKILGDSEVIQS
jgi:murein L,D-transpeptidase YafK